MKLYRAIEFSKLVFMLSFHGRKIWNSCNEDFINKKLQGKNWWLHHSFDDRKKELIADVMANGQKNFFQKSLTYNSISGGRYNPSNSFGILYTSNNPSLAALEVLFHIFDDKKKYLKSAQNNMKVFSDLFNADHPDLTKHLIVVFELKIRNYDLTDYRGDVKIKELCEVIGFDRYTSEASFDEDFIFGNNYEISRLAGSYLNAKKSHDGYIFRSARIANETQNHDNYNVIIPESFIEKIDPQLSGNYFFADASINISEINGYHDIGLKMTGSGTQIFNFRLEKPPGRRPDKDLRSKLYQPVLPDEFQPNLNTRYVCHQRFKPRK